MGDASAVSDTEADEIKEHLRGLGYIEEQYVAAGPAFRDLVRHPRSSGSGVTYVGPEW